jgi:hypothetical protein
MNDPMRLAFLETLKEQLELQNENGLPPTVGTTISLGYEWEILEAEEMTFTYPKPWEGWRVKVKNMRTNQEDTLWID